MKSTAREGEGTAAVAGANHWGNCGWLRWPVLLRQQRPSRTFYRDEIEVAEYFLFDPRSEYLNPALQGHRLRRGRYVPIAPVAGRLPSKELGLHLEADGSRLRFYDPANKRWLPTPQESRLEALDVLEQKDAALRRHQAALEQKDAALKRAEAEAERLRQELAALRRRP